MFDALTNAGSVAGALASIAVVALWGPKVWRVFRPIAVTAGIHLVFDRSGPEEIIATIVNRSEKTQYIAECLGRCTYSVAENCRRYLSLPVTSLKMRKHALFPGPSFIFPTGETLKVEPLEQVEIRYPLTHPLVMFLAPRIVVEVRLTTRRVVRSKSVELPERWLFKPTARK